ncbi:ATP-binding response regulator [Arcobacter roscoffensis]|uniref:histidine kinase n=1 Tax=Arcobacter roscoffensis TaxID=2961520 RepID=A0ABY5EA89_9BACT|nr:response regulator [Arcobacter roscoffensis]UTJ07640.1 response regulator [Arcobacter roscoffensis]
MKAKTLEDILILYVEDDEFIRNELIYFLEKKFKNIKVASNGEEGLELFEKYQPDIVITDIKMPKMSGIELSKYIRQKNSDTIIIVSSAHSETSLLDEAIEFGIDTFLIKPISLAQLYCTVQIAIEKIILKKQNEDTQNKLDETKKLLIEADKMAMIGNLVAGATHEISSPLGVGITSISHLTDISEKLKADYENEIMTQDNFESYLNSAIDLSKMTYINLQKASDLIKSFKTIAVDQALDDKKEFDLQSYLNEVIFSLNYVLKKVKVSVNIKASEKIQLNSYPGVFSQIFTNLINNSINHGFENLEEGNINITLSKNDNEIKIIYHDNGNGIDKEKLPNIFDKFYTTKKGKGGTGLGLNIIKDLVENRLNGSITCESSKKEGTSFEIILKK